MEPDGRRQHKRCLQQHCAVLPAMIANKREVPQSEESAVRSERGLAALAATFSASSEAVVRSFDGFFDRESGWITSVENPFGAKVLPMCPE